MVSLLHAVKALQKRRILIAGDLILDRYTMGHVRRTSPEAPVVIVHVSGEEQRPGGAGNAALNAMSLGGEVLLMGRVGVDDAGDCLVQQLHAEGIDTAGIVRQECFVTPLKNRIVAVGQQVVRIDYEEYIPLDSALEDKLLYALPHFLEGCDAIALSDYGKGTLTPRLLSGLIGEARKREIPVIADPKGVEFGRYRGASILKPNLMEAYAAAGCSREVPLSEVAQRLHSKVEIDLLMVTRSEDGISLFYPDGREEHHPVKILEVKDVTGAGDTVLAMVAFAIANDFSSSVATELANLAAGIAVEHIGCARVALSMMVERLLPQRSLCKQLQGDMLSHPPLSRDYHLLAIRGEITAQLFSALELLADWQEEKLLYFEEGVGSPMLMKALVGLEEVDYILEGKERLLQLAYRPTACYLLDENRWCHATWEEIVGECAIVHSQ